MIHITTLDYNKISEENVFEWLELFAFKRYGCKYYVNPKERDDPRYPAKTDESPIDWYTHVNIPERFYDRNVVIIDEELYEKIKAKYKEIIVDTIL